LHQICNRCPDLQESLEAHADSANAPMKLLLVLATLAAHLPKAWSLALARSRTSSLKQGLSAQLRQLEMAVEQGDVPSVLRITHFFVSEARRRAVDQNEANLTSKRTHPNLTHANVADHVESQRPGALVDAKALSSQADKTSHDLKYGTCLLDDFLFKLDMEGKTQLQLELQDPAMQEAMTWVQKGGWWFCANYGELCQCRGNVRMVDWDHTSESKVQVNALQPTSFSQGVVKCDIASFGNEDVKPGQVKVCECEHTQTDFHLHKRLSSQSLLQEAWIHLLRLLARRKLLPLGTGDRLYHGMENWAARHVAGTTPMVLERVWIEMFVKKIVAPGIYFTRCLEWGDPSIPGKGFNYANMVPSCANKFDMQFDPVHRGQRTIGMEGNVVYSDIDHLPYVLMAAGDNRMNLIFATQVFEHLHNPHQAVMSLYESLLPGGALVFTAPQQAQFHLVPHDFFRYTKEGALYLLQSAGFCVPPWGFAGGGDFVFDIARDAGLQVQDFPIEEITASFQHGYWAVSDSAITVHAIAYKPPHVACNDALPPALQASAS